ncbi:MAG: M61 family metallopeptidase [Nitriliruptorales bacterium]
MTLADPIRYGVDLTHRAQHLVTVAVEVPGDLAPGARVVLPVWTPGSYVVRDYVRHVQRIAARDGGGAVVELRPDGRTAWILPHDVDGPVTVELEIYGHELTVRTNHIDDHHALLIPAATFPYVEDGRGRQHEVRLSLPEGWRSWSLLPEDDGAFVADDYDHLVDSAFEAGDHPEVAYEVAGIPHRFVWGGHGGRPDLARIAADATAIGEAAAAVFGGDLPVDRYTFLCAAWSRGAGGLEHRDGAVLAVPVHDIADPDGYRTFQSLVAHEYFHLWNVKRLVPAALTALDYTGPVHTASLWVAEGWTAYYDELLPLRAALWTPKQYFDRAAEQVRKVLERPGRELQSVRMASHEAWTKFYVRDENSPNVGVSYYEHGAVLAWCLDLLLRREAPDGDGLDGVLRLLWERFGRTGRGYEEGDVEAAAADVAGRDLAEFFSGYVSGTEIPPIEDLLEVVGLRLREKEQQPDQSVPPDLGIETTADADGITIASVLRNRPAWRGGLSGGDRLLAIDGVRVGTGELEKVLRSYREGDRIDVTVFRGPRLVTAEVELGSPRASRELVPVDDPSASQRDAFEAWAGTSLSND